jgi:dolichol kinase
MGQQVVQWGTLKEEQDVKNVLDEKGDLSEGPPSRGRGRPVRKLIHVVLMVIPAVAWYLSYELALVLAGILLVASILVEAARRWWPWVNRLLWRYLPATFKEDEERRVLGSTWFSLGMLGALAFFGRDAGSTAILFLTWGDPAAEFAGRRWGTPGKSKTLVGSLGCLAACLMAGVVGMGLGGLSLWPVLIGAGVATAVERWAPPPDDNLWIPVLAGLAMASVQWLMYSV